MHAVDVDLQIAQIKFQVEETTRGKIWANDQFENAVRHGIGFVVERGIVQAIGFDKIKRRLENTGLRFNHFQIDGHDIDQFNAVFWVAEPKPKL